MRLYVLYLIWNYSTLTSLTLLLMTKNSWSKVGASKNLSVLSWNAKFMCWPCFVSWRHIKFSKICLLFWSEFMSEYFPKWVTQLFRLSNTDSANRFSFLKNFFILKVLNVLGLKNSIELKETMQYYTNLPIFEHFGC